MGKPRTHPPTVLIAAVFSRYGSALDWALEQMRAHWNGILLTSDRFEHNETAYYQRLMGEGLHKQLVAMHGDFDPAHLADVKLQSNFWEAEYASLNAFPEKRPLNIDPGYVTPMKVVLASTKDRAHRIYLRDGIYAEECLVYHQRSWLGRPWTYPDYLRADYHAFFLQVREHLQQRLAQAARSPLPSSNSEKSNPSPAPTDPSAMKENT